MSGRNCGEWTRWLGGVWLLAALASSAAPSNAVAQDAAINLGDELTVPERDALFTKLQSEVVEFQRHHALLKTLTRLVSPSVVHLDAKTTTDTRGRRSTVEEAGSGVIVEHKGAFYVVTNRHVIKDAANADITIRFYDGVETHPSRVLADAPTDLAVLAVSDKSRIAAKIGKSGEVEIGDFVLAMGSPFGLAHSVTYGIVSAKGRRDLELGEGSVEYQDFLQTDAAINPGNSGGPLFNLRGEVIGINTAIASNSGGSEGIGFAIPMDMAMTIARQLMENGRVVRGKMGVSLDPKFTYESARSAGLPRLIGARITRVSPSSAAETAGLKAGDVVVRFGGVTIDNDTHLVNVISFAPVNSEIPVDVIRDRKVTRVNVRLLGQ